MASNRRAARAVPAALVEVDPNRVTQEQIVTPRGPARAWFLGGVCKRVRVAGITYSWGEAAAVWAALHDGTFRPAEFGKHNR